MRKLLEKLRRDSLWMGIIMGIAIPAILFGIIFGIIVLILAVSGKNMNVFDMVSAQKLILLSIIPNVFILRYYLLKLKFDLTGRGILLITFVIGILFAVLEFI
ncbi:MAG: hypothetical protein PHQ33_01770 [Bacteroidales bacterium]|jgi:hypothetical protein|nr:hypothetical protein [Bacteroidales bacterium]MDD4394597.1 hypothetical protein [Bacteroidales bacterium]